MQKDRTLGLALSGGGFRASFFHIGVLARLAELDLLRPIQVISTVSGGSIIGALYYLHLKRLLESKEDNTITPDDYVEIVKRIEVEFLEGVEQNVRMRILSNLWSNLRMFQKKYSRSDRLSELLDFHFYQPVVGKKDIPMAELKIFPWGGPADFHPRKHNAQRHAKVPRLVLNATCLNTGHNWQFTASYMGEPELPHLLKEFKGEIDKNTRLRRLYYDESSIPKIKRLPLRVAVAASASVPGIFSPLPITELYPEMTIQLVDGGVHDNQGITPLLEPDREESPCDVIIVSDASGQMEDLSNPSPSLFTVLPRSSSISMDRVRDLELLSLDTLRRCGYVKESRFLHLKKDLPQPERTWIGGKDKDDQQKGINGMTAYGVDRYVQSLLAEVRTDLDSFTEVEAYSLMADAYKMASAEFSREVVSKIQKHLSRKSSPVAPEQVGMWRFGKINDYLYEKAGTKNYVRQLQAAKQRAFKGFFVLRPLMVSAVVVVAALLLLAVRWVARNWETTVDIGLYNAPLGQICIGLLVFLASLLPLELPILKNVRNRWREWVVRSVVGLVGFVIANLHLYTVDLLFKWQGRVKRLERGPSTSQ